MKNNINNNMKFYACYLRKSRKDMDAEAHGQGETLARHEKILRELAEKMNIKISKFYKEVVSGETIASRPVMQQLLSDVESGMWTGILVVEVERLARGNTLDQGIVSNAFQYSNTQIITPLKTYDPNNEYDEEYFEFGLFMSRREYKKINQRLHNGILTSVKEGKHVASQAPYGYSKYKLPKQKGYSLEINSKEAEIVQYIYNSYLNGKGLYSICNTLNKMGIKPRRSSEWGKSTITHILTNPVYIGKIRYNDKATLKKAVNGKIVRIKNDNPDTHFLDGIHEPIIDIETWNKVQNIRKNNLSSRTKVDYTIKNPMSSILKCGICGRSMQRITSPKRNDVRMCCKHCKKNVGSNIDLVESKLLQSLESLLDEYKIKIVNDDNSDIDFMLNSNKENQLALDNELKKINSQLNNLYDLLEQGIYSKEIFKERFNILNSKISEISTKQKILQKEYNDIINSKNNKEILIPKIEKVIKTYYETDNVQLKNKLLKSVLQKVEYTKTNPKSKEDFSLKLYPKLH